jgi:hypothetical protein
MHQNALFRDLGRLEGRLHHSPSRLSWLLAMRIRGVAYSAENAGVPVDSDNVRQWFSGQQITPRHLEGLNDPISVVTVAHYYLNSLSEIHDYENTIAGAKLSEVCDHQKLAIEWSPEEYRFYQKLNKAIVKSTAKMELGTTISRVANGCVKALQNADQLSGKMSAGQVQPIAFELGRSTPIAWMVAMRIPYLLFRAGIIGCSMPSLIPSLRFTDMAPEKVERAILARLATEVSFGMKELNRLEKERALLNDTPSLTKRSRIHAAADIMQVLPGIRREPLAKSLGITPQGAGYIIKRMRELTARHNNFVAKHSQSLL